MEEKNITKSDEEKDLGIIIDGKLKFRQHINIQTKKANQKLGMIKRSFCAFVSGPKCTSLHFDVLNFNSQSFDHCTSLSISFCKDALSSSLLTTDRCGGLLIELTLTGSIMFDVAIT
jgi:hypothetical protein